MEKKGFVYLVGAGCGSADLITLRGLRLLQTCDAVVYDDLIDPALLEQAAQAELYPAGKRCGRHSMPQPEINALLVRLGSEGKTVVRLKGGDPFVFGRGGEEVQALHQAGIPCEIVPGISSCIAVPAAAGIPVTHRGLSRSFHVITGHTAQSEDSLPESLHTLANLNGTLVFLMGLSQLERIANRLMEAGKAGSTPAAVVSGGNAPHPAVVRGTLKNIAEKVRQADVQAPAVIVVGETAAMNLYEGDTRPLAGVRVGLVGTVSFTRRLEERLLKLGARPVHMMAGRVKSLEPDEGITAFTKVSGWAVFTSQNGVEIFFERLLKSGTDVRRLAQCRFAAIGPVTAQALQKHGITADLVAHPATSQALAGALSTAAEKAEPIFLFRSANSTPELYTELAEQGFSVQECSLYRTDFVPLQSDAKVDYLVFGSAEGVKAWYAACGAPEESAQCVCIGPVTAGALSACGRRCFLTAEDISADGVVACILKDLKNRAGFV